MKLAAIYNVWDGEELLKGSMDCLKGHVDIFIIIWQDVSNYGEAYSPLQTIAELSTGYGLVCCHKYTPVIQSLGTLNETLKRNIGINIAKEYGCTHFLNIDVDEYYEDFGSAKKAYEQSGMNGSVCKIFTYFKKPTLRFDTCDTYYVPFIHKLSPHTIAGPSMMRYPFYVDPTRQVNEDQVVMLDIYMHHFSWVRKDIDRKAKNSSASRNIKRTTLVDDYYSPSIIAGSVVKDYHGKKLIHVENQFNIQL